MHTPAIFFLAMCSNITVKGVSPLRNNFIKQTHTMTSLTRYCLLALLTCLCCCTTENTDPPTTTEKSLEDLQEGILRFSYDQLTTLAREEEDNVIVSPLSILSALSMACEGAEGATYDQMIQTLHLAPVSPDQSILYEQLLHKFDNEMTNSELGIANAVFSDPNRIELSTDYKAATRAYYAADQSELDFGTAAAVDDINKWVANATNDRIPKVLDQISADEILFLINALYFKGDWANGFPQSNVSDRVFTKLDGSTTMALSMYQDSYYANTSTEEYTAVELYFKDSIYSMSFILPSAENTPMSLLEKYSSDSYLNLLQSIDDGMVNSRVFLQIPKMELTGSYSLKESLQSMGMTDAFDSSSADFNSMGKGGGNIYLSRVLHDVYLMVDDKGVEGAAATTVGVALTSAPPSISFDKPFLFILKHRESNVPIFMGIIRDPTLD